MVEKKTTIDTVYLGIDGGGSKCSAQILSITKGVVGKGRSGPANPSHGFEQAVQSIIHSTQLALQDAGMDHHDMGSIIAGIGLAGVNLEKFHRAMTKWEHPFRSMFVTSDLHTACLGAHSGHDGAVLIVGTGSCGFAHVDGQSLELGGHGFPHGDKGSGAWIGLQAFKIFLLVMDELSPKSLLTKLMHQYFEDQDVLTIVENMAPPSPSKFASLAPLVFEAASQGDKRAISIIEDGADYLNAVAFRLLGLKPPRISLLGGLSSLMTPWLDPRIVEQLSPPQETPETGAIYFAQKELVRLDKAV